ncbi:MULTISPECIES: hypothetical protein [Pseudomonas]|uniref:hypothetical protein n=1 Tax=Pseudomonas TaxID=286 RepID=UPI001555409B|nr:hypothetical protein [Pseudomonas tumuqii]
MTDLIVFILAKPEPTASLLTQLAHLLLKRLSRARNAGESLACSLSRQVRDYLKGKHRPASATALRSGG